jgi:hypothetical protein
MLMTRARGEYYDTDCHDPAQNKDMNDTQWTIVNTTTWNFNDDVTIKNIAGYVETRLARNYLATLNGASLDTVTPRKTD